MPLCPYHVQALVVADDWVGQAREHSVVRDIGPDPPLSRVQWTESLPRRPTSPTPDRRAKAAAFLHELAEGRSRMLQIGPAIADFANGHRA